MRTYCLFTIFKNMLFSKSHFSERPQEKYYHVIMLHSKSLKKCHENFENWFTNKINYARKFLNRAFSIIKMSGREVTIYQ